MNLTVGIAKVDFFFVQSALVKNISAADTTIPGENIVLVVAKAKLYIFYLRRGKITFFGSKLNMAKT